MRTLLLALILLVVPAQAVRGQTPPATTPEDGQTDANVNSQYIVESVEVKGLLQSRYSDGLFQDMQRMTGQRLDPKRVEDLRKRLSTDPGVRGEYMIRQKIERGSEPGRVKVIFEAERGSWLFRATIGRFFPGNISFDDGSVSIVDRQTGSQDAVEAVELNGVPISAVSDALYAELQAMTGKRRDDLETGHLLERLKAEFKNDYEVALLFRRGSEAGKARIVYHAKKIPWLPYRDPDQLIAYHPKQGFTVVCCRGAFGNDLGTARITGGWDGDRLVERTKGFTLAVESVSLGTRRLGMRVAFDSQGTQWKPQTRDGVSGAGNLGGLYRARLSLAPSLAFAVDRHVYVTGGLDFAALEMEGPVKNWDAAHLATGSLHYDTETIRRGRTTYQSAGSYVVHTGSRRLSSDYVYTRHVWNSENTIKRGASTLEFSLSGGRITGQAPLFERFVLGNTRTLRGWNKYDIAPTGGDRFIHGSLGYRYSALGAFVDWGNVWDAGSPHGYRAAVGLTLFGRLGVGFPVRCDRQCGATFYVRL